MSRITVGRKNTSGNASESQATDLMQFFSNLATQVDLFQSIGNAVASAVPTPGDNNAQVGAVSIKHIFIGAKGGELVIRGPGFSGTATVPPHTSGVCWFQVTTGPPFEGLEGGTFSLGLHGGKLDLTLRGAESKIVHTFTSQKGMAGGLEGSWEGNWVVQNPNASEAQIEVEAGVSESPQVEG